MLSEELPVGEPHTRVPPGQSVLSQHLASLCGAELVSTLGEQKAHNPRLHVKNVAKYADLMDTAVPTNSARREI